jgi:O-antigen/teichoic acid export membrane protein
VVSNAADNKMKGRLVWSVVDQASLSAFSLVLNLLLMRAWGPGPFGIFAIVLALTMVGYSVQQALIGSQLAILRAQAQDPGDDEDLVATLWIANCVLTASLAAVTFAVFWFWFPDYPFLAASGAAFVGCALLREYARSLLFSELKLAEVIITDSVFIAAACSGVAAVWGDAQSLVPILLVIAFANALSLAPTVWRQPRAFAPRLETQLYHRYRRIWRHQSQWALLGVVSWEILNRIHVFVVGSWFGVAAVGILQAGEMIFRPLGLVLQAWRRVAQPTFARLVNNREYDASLSICLLSAGGALLIGCAFTAFIYAAWDLLEAYVFRGQYQNIQLVVTLWAIVMILKLFSGVFSTQLEGFTKFRELSFTSLAGAFTATAVLLSVLSVASYEWSILAIAAGFSVDLFLVLVILTRTFAAAKRESADGSASPAPVLARNQTLGTLDVRPIASKFQPAE